MTSILLVIALFAPSSQPASQPGSQPAAKATNLMGEQAVVHRGAAFTLKEQITLDDVAAKPEAFAGKTVKVAGTIQTVCRKKGCWMTLAGTTPKARARITFKDYGFFAPLDAQGNAALVEGTVEVKTLSEAERKHLADDAGSTVDAIPAHELRLVATALEVRKLGH